MAWPTPLPTTRRNTIVISPNRLVVLGDEVGCGDTSTVYAGVLESLHGTQRRVAVKVIDAVPPDEQEHVLPAIVSAVQQAALVAHPNVATTYELAMDGDAPVVISEFIEGRSLASFIDAYAKVDRKVPPDLALFIATEIAEGLAGARDARSLEGGLLNVIHGEPSARDVLLSYHGDVKLTDFGLAQAIRAASGVRSIRSFARRAVTLSPEVARGRRPDARSDVFALGMLLREMLVGPRWPASTSDQDAFARAREGDMEMNVLEPRLYEPLAVILKRALEVDSSSRFPHAGAMAYELRRVGLPLGVGDNRFFLRHALQEMFAAPEDDTAPDSGPDSGPDRTQRRLTQPRPPRDTPSRAG